MDFLLFVAKGLACFFLVPVFLYVCVKFSFIGYFSAKRISNKMQADSKQPTSPQNRP